jgi:hypothetical protein
MVYTIKQERLMTVMMKFFNEILPDFELPLKTKTKFRKGNSGYGSGLDDYTSAVTYYIDNYGEAWFIEYGDKEHLLFADAKWDVNEKLEPLYNYFDEESFELFIKWLFKIDLKDKGVFTHDWTFVDTQYVITENKKTFIINEYIVDEMDDDKLMKIIRKFVHYIYGKDLTMVETEGGYLNFFSAGPKPPFQRNLFGRLWVGDNRLPNLIKDYLSIDESEAYALISFYFSNTYGIKINEAKRPPHVFFDKIDYSQFDDENYHIEDDED